MAVHELSEPLSVPFNELGGNPARPLPPSAVGVNNRMYLIDTASGE